MKLSQLTAIVLLGITAGGMGGCWSVYHRTADTFDFAPADRLELRLQEARDAARDALRDVRAAQHDFRADAPLRPLEHHAEGVSAAAWEFDRRVASVHDMAARAGSISDVEGSLHAMDAAAAALNDAASALEGGDRMASPKALDRAEASLAVIAGERQ